MDTYCSIYIAERENPSHLMQGLTSVVDGKLINDRSIQLDGKCHLDFANNLGYNKFLQSDFPDGFLYFRYKLDLTFLDGVDISYCVQLIENILNFFWHNDIPAVATADYEDQLLLKGGYKSNKIPWPGNISN